MCPSHVTLLRQAALPLEIRYNPEKILSEFNFGFQVLWMWARECFRTVREPTTGTSQVGLSRDILRNQRTVRSVLVKILRAPLYILIQDQVSSLIRDVRSSRIFDSNLDTSRSFESDFLPSTGMQKSCTASSIADLGKREGSGCKEWLHLCTVFSLIAIIKSTFDEISFHCKILYWISFMCLVTVHYLFSGKERPVKEEKIDFSKREDEKWKRRSLPAGNVQGEYFLDNFLCWRWEE